MLLTRRILPTQKNLNQTYTFVSASMTDAINKMLQPGRHNIATDYIFLNGTKLSFEFAFTVSDIFGYTPSPTPLSTLTSLGTPFLIVSTSPDFVNPSPLPDATLAANGSYYISTLYDYQFTSPPWESSLMQVNFYVDGVFLTTQTSQSYGFPAYAQSHELAGHRLFSRGLPLVANKLSVSFADANHIVCPFPTPHLFLNLFANLLESVI